MINRASACARRSRRRIRDSVCKYCNFLRNIRAILIAKNKFNPRITRAYGFSFPKRRSRIDTYRLTSEHGVHIFNTEALRHGFVSFFFFPPLQSKRPFTITPGGIDFLFIYFHDHIIGRLLYATAMSLLHEHIHATERCRPWRQTRTFDFRLWGSPGTKQNHGFH